MFKKIDQSKLDIQEESFLSIDSLKTGSHDSYIFRNILVDHGYTKFDAKKFKGDLCYDAYFKDFRKGNDTKYTIFCYCYDLKEIMEDSDLFEFVFESQIESGRGIIGIESVQWDFTLTLEAKENLLYFQEKINKIWESFGENKFPC
jgi:hypothetical protein